MNRSAQNRCDDRQDKERNEGEYLTSLRCRDGRPSQQYADQKDAQNDNGYDRVVCHGFLSLDLAGTPVRRSADDV